MKPINIEKLMNHSVGISDSYYRATENELLEDYLKAVELLTINGDQIVHNFFCCTSCPEWKAQHRRYYNCRDCDGEIYFDDVHISKNDKYIPLDKATGEPHQCEEE
jgi:Iap family predicted aminopeptidase